MNRLAFMTGNLAMSLILIMPTHAQQKPRTFSWVEPDGSQALLSPETGLTTALKGTSKTIYTPTELTKDCADAEQFGLAEMAPLCDGWAQLQSKTQIEQVSFPTLVYRLMKFSAPYTNFARYTGMKLKSDKTGIQYDALLVPNDLGKEVACTVIEGQGDTASVASYQCILKTMSYPAAIEVQKTLISRIKSLSLTEDQATEHGYAVADKGEYQCAPTGECEHTNMYVSALKDGRRLVIHASPQFIHNLRDEVMTLTLTGHDLPPTGIAPDSGFVTIEVWSSKASPSDPESQHQVDVKKLTSN